MVAHKCRARFSPNFRGCFPFFSGEKRENNNNNNKTKFSSFKCPVLLTFSYIFYSVFKEDNNLCLILGNSCKDNEILMIFHQVKCELQKKSYWIFMDLNRIKWDSWGIHITILSGPSKAAVPACIHCVVWGAALASDGKQLWRAGSAHTRSPSEIWQKFPPSWVSGRGVLAVAALFHLPYLPGLDLPYD